MEKSLSHAQVVKLIPDSVRQYLTDPKIYSAVGHITGIKKDELETGLEWGELGDFLEARANALLVKSEYAIASYYIWKALWDDFAIEGFRLADIDNQETNLQPNDVWEEDSFGLSYENSNDFEIQLYVSLAATSTELAFDVMKNGKSITRKWQLKNYKYNDAGWEDFMVAVLPGNLVNKDFDWLRLIEARDEAIAAICGHFA